MGGTDEMAQKAGYKNINEINGQYMGLMKINPNGWKKILKHIKNFYNDDVNTLDITNFLRI